MNNYVWKDCLCFCIFQFGRNAEVLNSFWIDSVPVVLAIDIKRRKLGL